MQSPDWFAELLTAKRHRHADVRRAGRGAERSTWRCTARTSAARSIEQENDVSASMPPSSAPSTRSRWQQVRDEGRIVDDRGLTAIARVTAPGTSASATTPRSGGFRPQRRPGLHPRSSTPHQASAWSSIAEEIEQTRMPSMAGDDGDDYRAARRQGQGMGNWTNAR